MWLEVAGKRVFAATGGKDFDPAKPAVVFIHGNACDHTVWALQTRWFAYHGFSVLALDLPGNGRSEGPMLTSIEAFADWMPKLLDAAQSAEGVQIFIGKESALFGLAGCSMIIAPYANSREQIVGAIGVIGPTRLNYARVIPIVDYTAKVIGRLIG